MICKGCGDEFTPRTKTQKWCAKETIKHCKTCGKQIVSKCTQVGKRDYCSKLCCTKDADKNKRISETKKSNIAAGIGRYANCNVCGDSFLVIGKQKSCNKSVIKKCKHCGKEFTAVCSSSAPTFCSTACGASDVDVRKQREATMIERYGVPIPYLSETIKQKGQETQRKRNNGSLGFNNSKQRETMMSKYGSPGRLGNKEERIKQDAIMLEKYGKTHPSQVPELLENIQKKIIDRHGCLFGTGNVKSKVNDSWVELLKARISLEITQEKMLAGKFFDICIEDSKLLIEINPTITHNSTKPFACLVNSCTPDCTKHTAVSETYHYEKAKIATEAGYTLIQIYDWDDKDKMLDFIVNKVNTGKQTISAHKTELRKIKSSEASKFFDEYHLQGAVKSQTFCYGLYYENSLVAAASFSKSRFKAKEQFEFLRYAVKSNLIIHGASQKLFRAFLDEAKPVSIVSYINYDHTTKTETFCQSLGFIETSPTGPALIYNKPKDNKRYPLTSLLMLGADRLIGTNYGPRAVCGLDNEQIMLKEGYLKVYTSGNRVFKWYNR
jgi:hypothetical protein